MNWTYEYGSYYLRSGNSIVIMTDEIAVCFDKDNFVVHKVGNPDDVNRWMVDAQKRVRDYWPEMAEAFVMMTLPKGFDVEEINRLRNNAQYLPILLKKLGVTNHSLAE